MNTAPERSAATAELSVPRRADAATATRGYRIVLAAAMVFAVLFYGLSAWHARHIDWNAMRLAPAAAVLRGEPIYPPANTGVVTGHIYSPLGALAFAPVAGLTDISTMMSAGSLLAMGFFALPFVLLARWSVRRGEVASLDAQAVVTAALLLAVFDVRLRYAVVMVHAEAPAVGLAGAAIVLGAAAGRAGTRGWLWSGVFAIAALMAKQTLLPTWFALAIAAAWGGRACLGRYLGGSLAACLACGAWVLLQEDWRAVLYNCLWIPAHHPWATAGYVFTWDAPLVAQTLAARGRALADAFVQVASPWWPAFALATWRLVTLRRDIVDTGSFAARAGTFALLAAVAQLPLALASFVKVGGDVNTLDPMLAPLTLMLAAMALEMFSATREDARSRLRRGFIAILMVLAVCNVPRFVFLSQSALERPDPNRAMLTYLRAHPGEVYLPWNPLHTWVAERRRDHFEYGVFDRALAGRPLTPEHYRAHLPPRMRTVAVRKSQPPARLDMFKHYLPELQPAASPAGLEDWTFYELKMAQPARSHAVQTLEHGVRTNPP